VTTLLDIARAVEDAPPAPEHWRKVDDDPLVCVTCGGDGQPLERDVQIARAIGTPIPTVCPRCRGTGRVNCEYCLVRPADRTILVVQRSSCALCDLASRQGERCAVCGSPEAGQRVSVGADATVAVALLHYPCGQLFCSEGCAVDPRHTCEIDRTLSEDESEDE
jgi:hypothetical protein